MNRNRVDQTVAAAARLALWREDMIEPETMEAAQEDADKLVALLAWVDSQLEPATD